jgi:hypothetical protein
MRDKILNKIIEFCIKKVGFIYNPYLVVATINPNRTEMIIKELKKNDISNKEDYLKWRNNFLKELKNL